MHSGCCKHDSAWMMLHCISDKLEMLHIIWTQSYLHSGSKLHIICIYYLFDHVLLVLPYKKKQSMTPDFQSVFKGQVIHFDSGFSVIISINKNTHKLPEHFHTYFIQIHRHHAMNHVCRKIAMQLREVCPQTCLPAFRWHSFIWYCSSFSLGMSFQVARNTCRSEKGGKNLIKY